MRLDTHGLKKICQKRGLSLNKLLAEAGVSRTAYYSLARKSSILPKSVTRLANNLGVNPTRFLIDSNEAVRRIETLRKETDSICRKHPECDRDVVLRTLMNLDLTPIERLRKALIRGRQPQNREKDRMALPALKAAAKAIIGRTKKNSPLANNNPSEIHKKMH